MRNAMFAAALAALLVWGGGAAPALAQQGGGSLPVPVAGKTSPKGGNKALMEDWTRQKRMVRDQAHQELKRLNALPRTGQVVVQATLLPDPANPGKIVVRIDSLQVRDTSSPGADAREVLPPASPSAGPEPAGDGRRVSETYSVVNGQLQAKP